MTQIEIGQARLRNSPTRSHRRQRVFAATLETRKTSTGTRMSKKLSLPQHLQHAIELALSSETQKYEAQCIEDGGDINSLAAQNLEEQFTNAVTTISKSLSRTPSNCVRVIRIYCENVPGMLYKATDCITHFQGNIIGARPSDPTPPEFDSTWLDKDELPYAGNKESLQVEYERDERTVMHIVAQWPNSRTFSTAWPSLRSNLRFLMEVHDVRQGVGRAICPGT